MNYGDPQEMGKVYMVERVWRRHGGQTNRDGHQLVWKGEALSKWRPAFVVGFRHLQNGWVEYGDGLESGRTWATDSVVKAVMMCWWPTERPFFCPLAGVSVVPKLDKLSNYDIVAPYRTTARHTVAEKLRFAEVMQKEMANWPRDEYGQWVKKVDK